MQATDHAELVVVGGGPGGYTAAIRAAQAGLDVTLVDADALGGTCLNHGCIPSKAFLAAADVAHRAATAESQGIFADVTVDFAELLAWKDGIVDSLTNGVDHLCTTNDVTGRHGRATFASDDELRITREDGADGRLTFDHAVLAVGSRPVELPGFGFDVPHVFDSRDALALEALPDRLLVVGAGYIGMELSTAFAKLGVDVTVVEALDGILPRYDRDLVAPVADRAAELGVDVHLDCEVADRTTDGDDVVVHTADGNAFTTDAVLVAIGREPATDTVDVESAGIATTPDGFVETDEYMRTSTPHIYAVGDVAGDPMLAHAAMAEGRVAVQHLAGGTTSLADAAIPEAVYTDPEVATVGMTEAEVRDAGYRPAVGRFPFRANGRALTTNDGTGFVKLVFDDDSHVLLGGQVVGPEASELVASLSLAVSTYMTATDVAETVPVHPTLSEAVVEAAQQALGTAVHTNN